MSEEERDEGSTVAGTRTQTLAGGRRDRAVRRVLIGVLVAFVVAACFGVFGYRQRTRTLTADAVGGDPGYTVELSHPDRTRGGLPARWSLTIERTDGAPLPEIEVATTADYLDLFDFNSLTPGPDAVAQTDVVTWTFAPSEASTMTVVLDIRTQPGARWGHAATTTVRADGDAIARFDYETTAIP